MHRMKHWLAAYLYYNEPWENFLKEGVQPFVKSVMKRPEVQNYFFIRYWERGPHIRLRFQGEPDYLEQVLKPELLSYFEKHFKERPSHRKDPLWAKEVSFSEQWFANNSVQFIAYEPETERYGGESGLPVSENQFQYSSDAVISALLETEEWSYERAMGVAIQMHLSFAFAMGMKMPEAREFFNYIFQGWLPMAISHQKEEQSTENIQKTMALFESTYVAQQSVLIDYHEAFWQAMEEKEEFENEWLNIWASRMEEIRKSLYCLNENKLLMFPSFFKSSPQLVTSAERQSYWSIYSSYIHMTNNRLGILNRDEGYLGYLMMKSLSSLEEKLHTQY
jgi:thiopeptide-type bacteriocin biosynthesis protein